MTITRDENDLGGTGEENKGFNSDEMEENSTVESSPADTASASSAQINFPNTNEKRSNKLHRYFATLRNHYKAVLSRRNSCDKSDVISTDPALDAQSNLNNKPQSEAPCYPKAEKSHLTSNMIENFEAFYSKEGATCSKKAHTNEGFVVSSSDEVDGASKQTFVKMENQNATSEHKVQTSDPHLQKVFREKPVLFPQIFGAVSSATVHLAVGCVVGFTGVTLPSLMNLESEDLILNKLEASIFSSIVNIGAIVGSVLSSLMMTWIGQRSTLLVYLPIGMLFWITMAFAKSFWLLILCRVIQGVVIGVTAGCANNYVVETVHKDVRGRLFALIDLSRQSGFLFMYLVGSSHFSWRYVGLICGLISMALPFLGMLFLPHSPRWLATYERYHEARKALVFFRGKHYDVDSELNDIQEQLHRNSKGVRVWDQMKMLTESSISSRLFVLAFLLFASHFTGNFALIAYSVSIFESAEVQMSPYLSTIIVAVARIFGVAIYMTIADRFGRKLLLITNLLLSAMSMFGLGLYFFIRTLTSNTGGISWLPLASVIFYVIFTMMSHPVLMLLRSELLPTSVRSVGVGLLYLAFFCGSFGVSISYPYMVDSVGSHWTFWLYGATSVVMVIVIFFSIPETQGKSLEDIEQMYEKKKIKNSV